MDLRKKHPLFKYENYQYAFKDGNLKISFTFSIEPKIIFTPKLTIKNVSKRNIDKEILENLVFNLGMIELLSYYKATCSPKIIVTCGQLSSKQKNFFKNLYLKGLGEFFYQNKIDFTKKDFLQIESISKNKLLKKKIKTSNKILLPIGGGKDSIVSLSLLEKEKPLCFALNPTKEIKQTIGKKKHLYVEREIDKKLLELNQKSYYNGHTPFSAYLAFLTTLVAYLTETKYIVLSNEGSANEETTTYLGKKINHQYSKTLEFENNFRKYSSEFLIEGIEYFSFLRPLHEIQIARIFSKLKKYYSVFLSCNEANKTCSGTKKKSLTWCGSCPKCLFVFTILYPFMEEKALFKIFNKNLFEDKNLTEEMLKLIGKKETKPFECVGTKKESLLAFYLSFQKNKNYYLLDYLNKKGYFKKIKPDKILTSFDEKNNLPLKFKKILKNEIRRA